MRAIYGIAVLRDEDLVTAWALGNLLDFCDHILVLENCSSDRTREIVRALAAKHRHVEVVEVEDIYDTHRFAEPLAGENLWVMKIDGDEIYDREGLARMRPRLLSGEFDHLWRVTGHTFHLTAGALSGEAEGYPSPPSKSVAGFLNFAAIEAWPSRRRGGHQRLHGHSAIRFRPDRSASDRLDLKSLDPWERCDVRNIHLCFLPRSSRSPVDGNRPAPSELMQSRRGIGGLVRSLLRLAPTPSAKKLRRYARGKTVRRALDGFGRPSDFIDIDPLAGEAEARLEAVLAARARTARR